MHEHLREWQPDSAKFSLEWLEPVEQEGVRLRPFRITTVHLQDGPVRTYGVVGMPEGSGPFPAILHIHGGCQTVCPSSVVYHIRRGYAAMSFDWSGNKPYSEYPAGIDTGDPLPASERNGADRCFPFLAAKAARGCLALLSSLDFVDSNRIGIYGVSWGGFITWLVNGTDSRPKCAVAIYGTGGLHWPGHLWNDQWGRLSEGTRRDWMQHVEPIVYAPAQRSPLLHINGANDFFGGFDVAAETLPAIPGDWRCDLTPNCNHGFDVTSTNVMHAWFDHYLKGGPAVPPAPAIKVTRIDDCSIRITTDGDPDQMTLWYSCGNAAHPDRCWHPGGKWRLGPDGHLSLDVRVTGNTWLYIREHHSKPDITVSSTPLCFSMPNARSQQQRVLFDGKTRRDGWGYRMSIMPQSPGDLNRMVSIDDAGVIVRADPAICGSLMFFGLSDPDCLPADDTSCLEIELEGAKNITVGCVTSIMESFDCTLDSPADGMHRLDLGRFRNGAGTSLPDFQRVGHLLIAGTPRDGKSFRIRRILWA